jgi:hypothetical protein
VEQAVINGMAAWVHVKYLTADKATTRIEYSRTHRPTLRSLTHRRGYHWQSPEMAIVLGQPSHRVGNLNIGSSGDVGLSSPDIFAGHRCSKQFAEHYTTRPL